MMHSRTKRSNLSIIARVSCKCNGFLIYATLTVLLFYQISKKDIAALCSHNLNTRKSFKNDHTKNLGQFGDAFWRNTSVITSGAQRHPSAPGRSFLCHLIVSGRFTSHKKNILYRSYRQQWWNHCKYQYDAHQEDDPEKFSFQKFKTELTLPDDAVPCDAINEKNG